MKGKRLPPGLSALAQSTVGAVPVFRVTAMGHSSCAMGPEQAPGTAPPVLAQLGPPAPQLGCRLVVEDDAAVGVGRIDRHRNVLDELKEIGVVLPQSLAKTLDQSDPRISLRGTVRDGSKRSLDGDFAHRDRAVGRQSPFPSRHEHPTGYHNARVSIRLPRKITFGRARISLAGRGQKSLRLT